jgi:hypothetical protein
VRDLQEESTEIVSLTWDGVPPRSDCRDGRCTADGSEVLFTSDDQAIVPDDSNQANDIFVRNRLLATTERVSVGTSGEQFGGESGSCSDDGRFVGFTTGGAYPDDTNDTPDAYDRDRLRGTTFRVSISSSGQQSARGSGELDLHGSWGGDLLVDPLEFVPVPLPPAGYTLHGTIPFDAALWGRSVWLQTIEVDPTAAKGFSSTDGLELDFGH